MSKENVSPSTVITFAEFMNYVSTTKLARADQIWFRAIESCSKENPSINLGTSYMSVTDLKDNIIAVVKMYTDHYDYKDHIGLDIVTDIKGRSHRVSKVLDASRIMKEEFWGVFYTGITEVDIALMNVYAKWFKIRVESHTMSYDGYDHQVVTLEKGGAKIAIFMDKYDNSHYLRYSIVDIADAETTVDYKEVFADILKRFPEPETYTDCEPSN